jgi:hypothetical protein
LLEPAKISSPFAEVVVALPPNERRNPKMRIDFTRPLFDFSGEALRDGDKPLVLGVVTVNALIGIYPDEQNLDGGEMSADTGLR